MFSFIILMIVTIGVFIVFKIESESTGIDKNAFQNLQYTSKAKILETMDGDQTELYAKNIDNVVNVHNVLVTLYYLILVN